MFEGRHTSLGTLDECDSYWAFQFLKGTCWEEQFEAFDSVPPTWLLKWSEKWICEDIFTIDDIDPLIGEYSLIFDNSCGEVWGAIHQGDDRVVFKRIPSINGKPYPDEVCTFFLNQIQEIGVVPFVGNFTVNSTKWIPRERMEEFLKMQMKLLSQKELHGLTLAKWLKREYGTR